MPGPGPAVTALAPRIGSGPGARMRRAREGGCARPGRDTRVAYDMKVHVPFLALLLAGTGSLAAQGGAKSFPEVDPYTKNAPAAVEKAGYVSLGPFRFGPDHTTDQVESVLEGVPLLWVETEHFKLGSGLPEYVLGGDPREKERIRAELERLSAKLPSIKTKTKKLDPWLRLHLFAQRLEELYGHFLAAFDLRESEFPTAPPDERTRNSPNYMGEGRYLGMSSKFTVLLFAKKSHVARYSSVYLGQAFEVPTRWHLASIDSWLYVSAAEFLEGEYDNDSALACDVVGAVSKNLAAGVRGAAAPLPFAVGEGLAHWFSRQIDPRYHLFAGLDPSQIHLKEEWNWAPSVRDRVEHRVYPSTADMLAWSDTRPLEWADHLVLWSRMDYLFAREDGAAGRFLRRLKAPFPKAKGTPTPEARLERVRESLASATDTDLAGFDAAWSAWVLASYPEK